MQVEGKGVAKTDKANHAGIGLECGVLDLAYLVLEQAQAKAEVVNHQTNGVLVGDRIGGRNGAIMVRICAVRTANTDKGLHMAGANGEGIGQHRHVDATDGLGGERLAAALLEGKRATDVNELRYLQRGVVQTGTNRGAGHVQQNRRGARGNLVARADRYAGGQGITLLEVDGRCRTAGGIELEVNAGERELEVVRIKAVERHGVGVRLGSGVLDTGG